MKQIVVTAGVIVADNRFLMAQRRLEDSEGGKWEFPGGKVEFGEEPRAALKRELAEELGIEVTVLDLLEVVSEVKGSTHLILLYFRCVIFKGDPIPLQCQAVAWYSPVEADTLEKPPADRRFWGKFRLLVR